MQFLLAPLTYFITLLNIGLPVPIVAGLIIFVLVAVLRILIELL